MPIACKGGLRMLTGESVEWFDEDDCARMFAEEYRPWEGESRAIELLSPLSDIYFVKSYLFQWCTENFE